MLNPTRGLSEVPFRAKRGVVIAAVLGLTISLVAPAAAQAATAPDEIESVANAVEAVVSDDVTAAQPTGGDAWEASNAEVKVEGNPDGVSISLAGADPFDVGLPLEADPVKVGVTDSGTVAAVGRGDSVDVSIQTLDNGVRIATIIDSAAQPTRFTYPLESDIRPVINEDGSVDLYRLMDVTDPDTGATAHLEATVASVTVPWATDAKGNDVATHYEVTDGSLVQVVDHRAEGVAYPVVADPQITPINAVQVRVRWNRAETATIAAGGWGATGLTAVCLAAGTAIGGPIGAAAVGASCLATAGSGVYTAGVAQNSRPKKCVQLTITLVPGIIIWWDTYSGGICR